MIPAEEWHLPSERIGRRVLVFDRLGSTNALAMALAREPGNENLAILAREQTAGRGAHGRSWHCPAGAGVLMSVIVRPPVQLGRPTTLTAWATLAVCELISALAGLNASIKWPNDVLMGREKVCGVLIERGSATVVGIGLNVNQDAESFRAAGLSRATSLHAFAGHTFEADAVARMLVQHLDRGYCAMLGGELDQVQARWRNLIGLLGKSVCVEHIEGSDEGELHDLTWEGIELRTAAGSLHFQAEVIRRITAA
jgi:BirA family biotin operon repressor/biotin-[acetyl-CoA-carboxylase] ligase